LTVCIATIYGKNGHGAFEKKDNCGMVVTADRLVSYERGAFTYEGKARKIKFYEPNKDVKFALMGTGAVNYIEDFFRRFGKTKLGDMKSLEEVAQKGAEVAGNMAKDSMESMYLRPLGLDWAKLYHPKSSVPEPISTFITDGIKGLGGGFQDGLHVLVAGLDYNGPHIYLVEDFDYTEVGTLGYHAVGMGDRAARISLENNLYGPFMNKNQSVFLSLISKFQAEEAHGVGRETDCGIISFDDNGIVWLSPEQIDNIRKIYINDLIPTFVKLIRDKSNKLDVVLKGVD
jgi:hypothetical protein